MPNDKTNKKKKTTQQQQQLNDDDEPTSRWHSTNARNIQLNWLHSDNETVKCTWLPVPSKVDDNNKRCMNWINVDWWNSSQAYIHTQRERHAINCTLLHRNEIYFAFFLSFFSALYAREPQNRLADVKTDFFCMGGEANAARVVQILRWLRWNERKTYSMANEAQARENERTSTSAPKAEDIMRSKAGLRKFTCRWQKYEKMYTHR